MYLPPPPANRSGPPSPAMPPPPRFRSATHPWDCRPLLHSIDKLLGVAASYSWSSRPRWPVARLPPRLRPTCARPAPRLAYPSCETCSLSCTPPGSEVRCAEPHQPPRNAPPSSNSLPNSPFFYVRALHVGSQISPRRTSRRFRLTPHLAELAGNSQMLPERGSLGTRRACLSASPKALSRPFRARVSQSPVRVRVWLTGGSALESPWRFFDREPAGDGEFLKCERQVHWEEQISPSGGHLKTGHSTGVL